MKMHSRVLVLLAVLLASACSPSLDGRESFGDKTEWSILQGHEYRAREAVVTAPQFKNADEYVLLVVPSADQTKNIWIMLNPKSPPFYKQIPQGNFTISQALLDIIARQQIASSTVEEVLASHVAG